MPDYLFAFFFDDDDQVGVPGLTGAVDIRNVATGASVETGLTPVEVGDGVYSIVRSLPEADYTGVMKTAANGWRASLSVKEIPRIDAAVSSRLSSAAWTTGLASILAAIAAIPAAAWAWATRTLTMTPSEITAKTAGSLEIRRGDTYTHDFANLGDLSGRTALIWTMKENLSAPDDSSAIVQVDEASGLGVLNADDGTAAHASLTVLDEVAGNVRLVIKAEATTRLTPVIGKYYDLQITKAGVNTLVNTLEEGSVTVRADVTRRLS